MTTYCVQEAGGQRAQGTAPASPWGQLAPAAPVPGLPSAGVGWGAHLRSREPEALHTGNTWATAPALGPPTRGSRWFPSARALGDRGWPAGDSLPPSPPARSTGGPHGPPTPTPQGWGQGSTICRDCVLLFPAMVGHMAVILPKMGHDFPETSSWGCPWRTRPHCVLPSAEGCAAPSSCPYTPSSCHGPAPSATHLLNVQEAQVGQAGLLEKEPRQDPNSRPTLTWRVPSPSDKPTRGRPHSPLLLPQRGGSPSPPPAHCWLPVIRTMNPHPSFHD